ncbi:MAG: hypothetical protein ABFS34_09350 [Gemmatimonadota bacterium]
MTQTEHLDNVRPSLVVFGWLVAVAVGSLVGLVLAAVFGPGAGGGAGMATALVAVAVGFFAGGFVAGFGALRAPILHGVAMGIVSLVAWSGLNLVAGGLFADFGWETLGPTAVAIVLLAQMAFAAAGALAGRRTALRGREPEAS